MKRLFATVITTCLLLTLVSFSPLTVSSAKADKFSGDSSYTIYLSEKYHWFDIKFSDHPKSLAYNYSIKVKDKSIVTNPSYGVYPGDNEITIFLTPLKVGETEVTLVNNQNKKETFTTRVIVKESKTSKSTTTNASSSQNTNSTKSSSNKSTGSTKSSSSSASNSSQSIKAGPNVSYKIGQVYDFEPEIANTQKLNWFASGKNRALLTLSLAMNVCDDRVLGNVELLQSFIHNESYIGLSKDGNFNLYTVVGYCSDYIVIIIYSPQSKQASFGFKDNPYGSYVSSYTLESVISALCDSYYENNSSDMQTAVNYFLSL